jgi:hypothetical protein
MSAIGEALEMAMTLSFGTRRQRVAIREGPEQPDKTDVTDRTGLLTRRLRGSPILVELKLLQRARPA